MKKLIATSCLLFSLLASASASAVTAVGTETVLNKMFGVNLHMDNCCNGNYADVDKVISELQYIGARRARDWATTDSVVDTWRKINSRTGIKFHASIPQTTPNGQRESLDRIKNWLQKYPGLIDVIEGSNEPDTDYPKSRGASLVDSTYLQTNVYDVGKAANVKVAQLSVGGGWTAPLYEGNYKSFGNPPADFGNSHAYMTTGSTAASTLKRIGDLASYSVKGKPVDTTEFGTYKANQDDNTASAYMHLAPFDAFLLGHAGLFVYALHDDMSNVVSFYDSRGNKRPVADYWHYTTSLLSDPNGTSLPDKNIDISFTNQRMKSQPPLGIRNVVMYKSDGTIWIATYDEETVNSPDGFQTIVFDKTYKSVKLYDARNGQVINQYSNINKLDINLPVNRLFLVQLSAN